MEKASPTAIPSGMLCRVTASTIMVVRLRWAGSPSGSLLPMWRWGVSRSRTMRKAPPSRNPPPTGRAGDCPISSAISIEGMSRDQTEAATITPAAKPRKIFWVAGFRSSRKKNTMGGSQHGGQTGKAGADGGKGKFSDQHSDLCPRDWGTFSLCRAGPFYLGVPAPGAGQNRNPGSRPGRSSSSRNIPAVRASNSAGSAALRSFLA